MDCQRSVDFSMRLQHDIKIDQLTIELSAKNGDVMEEVSRESRAMVPSLLTQVQQHLADKYTLSKEPSHLEEILHSLFRQNTLTQR